MEQDLGYRRIQFTGRGSYITSLPKEWIDKIGIGRGSEIAFKVQDDLSLLLVPRGINEVREETKVNKKEYYVFVESTDSPQSVARKISALYVVSADLIHICFKNGSDYLKHKAIIHELVRDALLGSEIINESNDEMTIQALVSHSKFPIEKAIWRMASVALFMNRDIIIALKRMHESILQGVLDAHHDVSRLDSYIVRQLKFGIERNLLKELGFETPKEFLGYRIATNNIKGIADNAINIANNILVLNKHVDNQIVFLGESVDDELCSQLLDSNSLAQKSFKRSLTALFERDYEAADKLLSETDPFAIADEDLFSFVFNKKFDIHFLSIVRLILDGSRRIVEHSRNIAEVTLNRTVEQVCSVQTFRPDPARLKRTNIDDYSQSMRFCSNSKMTRKEADA